MKISKNKKSRARKKLCKKKIKFHIIYYKLYLRNSNTNSSANHKWQGADLSGSKDTDKSAPHYFSALEHRRLVITDKLIRLEKRRSGYF